MSWTKAKEAAARSRVTSSRRVLDAVADGVDPVVEGGGGQHQVGRARHLDRLGADLDGHRAQVEFVVVDAGGAQAVDVLLSRRRIEEGDRVRRPVQAQALEDPGQAQAVVAVQVGQADDADAARRDAGEGHLPLGALAGVEQDAGGAPAQEVAGVVALRRGHEAAGAQGGELAPAHSSRPLTAVPSPRRATARRMRARSSSSPAASIVLRR